MYLNNFDYRLFVRTVKRTDLKHRVSRQTNSPASRTQTQTMVQATGITGVVETISPSPAYWVCIENFTNAPAESRIANKLYTKNHMKFHTILLNELLETLKMVSTLSCMFAGSRPPR